MYRDAVEKYLTQKLSKMRPSPASESVELKNPFNEVSGPEGNGDDSTVATYSFNEHQQQKGSWMFEVTVQSSDLTRVGWSPVESGEEKKGGVGTYPNSFSIEGYDKTLWINGVAQKTDSEWVPGDVIGCCVNYDAGSMCFYRNGRKASPLLTPGLVKGAFYVPSVSLGVGSKAIVNLGELPLVYPVDGYTPLAVSNDSCDVVNSDVEYLGDCVLRAVLHDRDCSKCDQKARKNILQCAVEHYAEIIKRGGKSAVTVKLIATSLCKVVAELVGTEDGNLTSMFFSAFRSSFTKSKEDDDLYGLVFTVALRYFGILYKECPVHLAIRNFLGGVPPTLYDADGGSQAAQDIPPSIPFIGPQSLEAISYMLNFASVPEFSFAGSNLSWAEDVLSIRELTQKDLDGLYPRVWWQFGHDMQPAVFREISAEASRRLEAAYELSRNYQIDIVQFMYEHNVLAPWLTALVERSMGYRRTVVPPGLPSVAMLSNVFHVCTRFAYQCEILGSNTKSLVFPTALLYGMNGVRSELERVGGAPGYLLKEFCEEVPPLGDSPAAVPPAWVVVDALASLFCLAEARRVAELHSVANELSDGFTVYERIVQINSEAIASGDTMKVMGTIEALGKIKLEIARLLRKRSSLIDFVAARAEQGVMAGVMKLYADAVSVVAFSDVNVALRFLPQPYFETILGLYTTAKQFMDVFPMFAIAEQNGALHSVLEIAARLMGDKRIVSPDIAEALEKVVIGALQTSDGPEYRLLTAPSTSLGRKVLEGSLTTACSGNDNDDLVLDLCEALTSIFTVSKTTTTATSLSPSHSSPLEDAATELLTTRKDEILYKLCDKLFDVLNLMLSSFELALNDLFPPAQLDASSATATLERRVEKDKFVPVLKRVVVIMEKARIAVRSLESLSRTLPILFWGRELNYARVCEVLGFFFDRMRPGSPVSDMFESLQQLVEASGVLISPPLSKVTVVEPFVALAASMWKHNGIEAVYRFKRMGIPSASFMWAMSATSGDKCPELPVFTQFCDTCSRINDGSELSAVEKEKVMTPLEQAMSMVSLDDEGLCEICFANKIDTEFVPCGHRSCKVCIERHMITDQSCFFCKAHIDSFRKL